LTFAWTANGGSLGGSGGSTVSWTAPTAEGIFQVNVTVTDDEGLSIQATTTILVKNFIATAGDLVAYYPFTGNAADASGNQLHGVAGGGMLYVPDFWGNPGQAARFDGLNDRVTVANSPILNFQDAITVSAWFRPQPLPDHETFLISHGSWQNRWKISFTPEGKIRWTVNTLSAIGDLDSEISVAADSVYHLTATYDGSLMALYLDGRLHSYKPLSGLIRTAALPLLIGQMLPDNTDFNYPGIIDEVKIFDHALIPDEVQTLFDDMPTAVGEIQDQGLGLSLYPNPVRELLTVQLLEPPSQKALFSVIDLNGKTVFEKAIGPETEIFINTKHWKSGIYTAVIRSERIFQTRRFIKM
jgi:hypothetical protein